MGSSRGSDRRPARVDRLSSGRSRADRTARLAKTLIVVAVLGAIAAAVTLNVVRHRKPAIAVVTPTPSARPVPPPPIPAVTIPPLVVKPRPPAHYVGAGRCGDCHGDEVDAWAQDWHAKALAPAIPQNVVGDFHGAHFAGTSTEATMTREGSISKMTTRGPDGTVAPFGVRYVIGGKRMQDAVTVLPDGRWQVLPVYFHVTKHEWVDFTERKQGALTPDSPFYWTNVRRMANHECLDCHTTDVRESYDASTQQWQTAFADARVACESCHGPGGTHADSQDKADIVNPKTQAAVAVAACARCHGPRAPTWPLFDHDHAYRVGDDYDEAYDPIVVTLPGGGTSSDFFADGRPATSSFEYQAMLQSACYRKGGATCLTCHTAPHAEHRRPNELRDEPDQLCASCHAQIAADPKAHSHHATPAGQSCVGCHMPHVVAGVLDQFADHTIDVPQISSHGHAPDACTACHAQVPAAQLATQLATWWPDAPKRQARRARLADAIDETTATRSEPALRAVIADADEAPSLRGAAMVLLGRRFGPPAADAITPQLAASNLVLRAKACEALEDAVLAAQRARQPLLDRATTDAIATHLGDSSVRVREACAFALFTMHDPRGLTAIRALAERPETAGLANPHLELGERLGGEGDFEGARTQLATATTLMPYYLEGIDLLAATQAQLGDYDAARATVARVLAVEPTDARARALLAKLPPVAPAP